MAVTKAIKAIAKQLFANPKNYGGKRSLSSIKYIVIHYTVNDGDTDEANAKYFHNNVVKASAHYFVDDDSYTKSVPIKNIAWSVGGKNIRTVGRRVGENITENVQTQTRSILNCVTRKRMEKSWPASRRSQMRLRLRKADEKVWN